MRCATSIRQPLPFYPADITRHRFPLLGWNGQIEDRRFAVIVIEPGIDQEAVTRHPLKSWPPSISPIRAEGLSA